MKVLISRVIPMRWSVDGLMATEHGNRHERRTWWQWRGRVFGHKTVPQ